MKFENKYVLATTLDIKSWSYGAIEHTRKKAELEWRDAKSTLNDPRIFGPTIDMQCACKKYVGNQYEGIICDCCGVKVTHISVRAERFAHINLKQELQYTLGSQSRMIGAFPVMPARYRQSDSGLALNSRYEQILESNQAGDMNQIYDSIEAIKEILLPLMQTAYGWDLPETDVIARGLVLTKREE